MARDIITYYLLIVLYFLTDFKYERGNNINKGNNITEWLVLLGNIPLMNKFIVSVLFDLVWRVK